MQPLESRESGVEFQLGQHPRPQPADDSQDVRRALGFSDVRVLVVAARLAMFAITGAAAGVTTGRAGLTLVSLLAVPATLASVTLPRTAAHRVSVLGEALICALAVGSTGGRTSPLLAYLVIPAIDAGVSSGELDALVAAGTSALGLLSDAFSNGDNRSQFLASSAQWIVISLAIGLLSARLRRLGIPTPTEEDAGFKEAARLLDDLREVARRLPGSLEPISAANVVLEECLSKYAMAGGAVLQRTSGFRLEPLAMQGWSNLPSWVDARPFPDVRTTIDTLPYWVPLDPARPAGHELLVLTLVTSTSYVGVVLLGPSTDGRRPSDEDLGALVSITRRHALRLEASLLFDELRILATTEERRRLAREIHDGIAQELVHLGYAVDALSHEIPPAATAALDDAAALRVRLTQLISELRLSIFDLRTSVDTAAGLGASISEYARTMGGVGGMTVHLRLRESAAGLPSGTAFELLRIAQEAVSNARKHSGARNLWVTLTTSPPYALLRVEDDGSGIPDRSGPGSGFGLSVMHERAVRLGSVLTVSPRLPAGTTVQVEIGQTRKLSVRDTDNPATSPSGQAEPDVLDYLS